MASFTVTTLEDEGYDGSETAGAPDGAGLSLREALGLALANGAATSDTITFSSGGTIFLTSGELIVDSNVTINGDIKGDNKADITLDGSQQDYYYGIFEIQSGVSVLHALTMTRAVTGDGGGAYIFGGANVTISDSTISNNQDGAPGEDPSDRIDGSGGGIYNSGTLTLLNSTIMSNTAWGSPGG